MKRLTKIIVLIITLFLSTNVYAKDTVYSINKYEDEELKIINKSYNKDLKEDGLITAGTFLKEKVDKDDNELDNYQVMLIKYKKSGKVAWTYRYGRTSSENITNLVYSYDSNNNIDGYIMVIDNSYDILTSNESKSYFVKIDLDGKFVFEKETNLNTTESIIKIIPTYSIDNIVSGYIGITNNSIIKYDKELNLIQRKDYSNSNYLSNSYIDINNIYKDNNVVGYTFIRKLEIENNKYKVELLKYNTELTEEKIITEDISNYDSYKLANTDNGFILYGITSDVKVKKGDSSYYIIKYDSELNNTWESIGTIAINNKEDIDLYSANKDKYFLLYKNNDSSYEVIKLDNEANLDKKVKKIKNPYYKFISFIVNKNEKELYFVGQFLCPEDEKCDYDTNSLFLISTEDKVIEVQDSTSTGIILVIVIFIFLLGTGVYLIKKKQLKK